MQEVGHIPNKLTSGFQLIDSNIPLNNGLNTYYIREKGNFREVYIVIRFIDSNDTYVYFPDLAISGAATVWQYLSPSEGTIIVSNNGADNIVFNVTTPDTEGQEIRSIYAR